MKFVLCVNNTSAVSNSFPTDKKYPYYQSPDTLKILRSGSNVESWLFCIIVDIFPIIGFEESVSVPLETKEVHDNLISSQYCTVKVCGKR